LRNPETELQKIWIENNKTMLIVIRFTKCDFAVPSRCSWQVSSVHSKPNEVMKSFYFEGAQLHCTAKRVLIARNLIPLFLKQ